MPGFNSETYIPQVAIDCVIFGFRDKKLSVLISKLHLKGEIYGLPSGFIKQDEGLEDAAQRILKERTGLSEIYLEHFKNFGNANRTNRDVIQRIMEYNTDFFAGLDRFDIKNEFEWLSQRFISICYYALVDINKVTPTKTEMDESLEWYDIHALPGLMMDHKEIVDLALESLRQNLDKNIIILNLLPEKFIMKEVQDLYETVFETTYARNNFQKKILDLGVLDRLEKKFTGAQNKAPYLYRFKK
ncbi:NrtR DNA-binding winged helix domain-containing protein [Jiulongibacter sediminis]|jgi:ADP-ribose pyrophosphatase YjhB (NUDIX family)|uniref:NUDIX hydrolase n=1 Tax=Jiulongibacter sediminis TaxID=1605367 RepID=UPI0026ECCDDA|nr:NUDIX domain-containing protein [Jiulongibacter sediminis]